MNSSKDINSWNILYTHIPNRNLEMLIWFSFSPDRIHVSYKAQRYTHLFHRSPIDKWEKARWKNFGKKNTKLEFAILICVVFDLISIRTSANSIHSDEVRSQRERERARRELRRNKTNPASIVFTDRTTNVVRYLHLVYTSFTFLFSTQSRLG